MHGSSAVVDTAKLCTEVGCFTGARGVSYAGDQQLIVLGGQ